MALERTRISSVRAGNPERLPDLGAVSAFIDGVVVPCVQGAGRLRADGYLRYVYLRQRRAGRLPVHTAIDALVEGAILQQGVCIRRIDRINRQRGGRRQ